MRELISVGTTAPDFQLADQDGARHRLADLLNRTAVLLVFYPGNNTPG